MSILTQPRYTMEPFFFYDLRWPGGKNEKLNVITDRPLSRFKSKRHLVHNRKIQAPETTAFSDDGVDDAKTPKLMIHNYINQRGFDTHPSC